ncbi:hypothetical protein BABINDRAFT_9710 [Babjeviella inositovora NRRL Y-12698]|uniref:C3H1-type domain-containing protein n=1 Tax=Babjeviella inositovora NRRL Y-12698 TaxID=984486 RepID=A0A1E3QKG7_9ASCO|nr:uncharacterized protein BABINDRAFT_9710 [Babjeviella inositovora NRRL Y-12698]ODQ78108.1 hypothetical protein BABINDRAFT_9710 [Babjeviella inositovora NRRL Y-12698]
MSSYHNQHRAYGSEQDKVNCTFYYKIGACRHGAKCSRKHIQPASSHTVLCPNFFQNPLYAEQLAHRQLEKEKEDTTGAPTLLPFASKLDPSKLQQDFDAFYKDLCVELATNIGEIDEIIVCENTNAHLNGNVYIKFLKEAAALKCVSILNNRWYDGRPIYAELSPVENFNDSVCRQWDAQDCNRGGLCNFMHVKRPTKSLASDIFKSQRKYYIQKAEEEAIHGAYSRARV